MSRTRWAWRMWRPDAVGVGAGVFGGRLEPGAQRVRAVRPAVQLQDAGDVAAQDGGDGLGVEASLRAAVAVDRPEQRAFFDLGV